MARLQCSPLPAIIPRMADSGVPSVVGEWKGTVVENAYEPYAVFYVDQKRIVGHPGNATGPQVIDDVILIISTQSDPYGYATDLVHRYEETTITGNIQYPGRPPALVAGVVTNQNGIVLVTGGGSGYNGSMSGQFNTAPGGHQGLNGLIRGIMSAVPDDSSDVVYYGTFSFGRYVAVPRDRVTDLQFPETLLP